MVGCVPVWFGFHIALKGVSFSVLLKDRGFQGGATAVYPNTIESCEYPVPKSRRSLLRQVEGIGATTIRYPVLAAATHSS